MKMGGSLFESPYLILVGRVTWYEAYFVLGSRFIRALETVLWSCALFADAANKI
jgi:hypothetical protein